MLLKGHIPALSFNLWLRNDPENKRCLLISVPVIIVQFIWFKCYYPDPNFLPDSYSYLEAALTNQDINMWPIGYSKFLRLFSCFTQWDTALIFLSIYPATGQYSLPFVHSKLFNFTGEMGDARPVLFMHLQPFIAACQQSHLQRCPFYSVEPGLVRPVVVDWSSSPPPPANCSFHSPAISIYYPQQCAVLSVDQYCRNSPIACASPGKASRNRTDPVPRRRVCSEYDTVLPKNNWHRPILAIRWLAIGEQCPICLFSLTSGGSRGYAWSVQEVAGNHRSAYGFPPKSDQQAGCQIRHLLSMG